MLVPNGHVSVAPGPSGARAIQMVPTRKSAEPSRKPSESRFRRLFETAQEGHFIVDAETGRISDINAILPDLIGYESAELLGRPVWEIPAFHHVVSSRTAFQRLQAQEYFRLESVRLQTRTDSPRDFEFDSHACVVDGLRVVQCSIRDITDRHAADEAIRKANVGLLARVSELERHEAEMRSINRMNELLQTCVTELEAYEVVKLLAGELFPGQDGCLAMLRSTGQFMETVACWGEHPPTGGTFSIEDCWGMRRGQPHEVVDSKSGLVCRHVRRRDGIETVCVPLSVQGETIGLLCLSGPHVDREERLNPGRLAVTVGESIKLSLSNLRLRERLHDQAMYDALTGLYNRRHLEESLPRELHRAVRGQFPLCVAMLDLDYFKAFNDAHGHDAGDALLREMGQILRDHVRKSDLSCRYGGEEFALVFPASSLADTVRRIEQIRQCVRAVEVRHRGQLLGAMTVSIGVAAAPQHGATASDLLKAADEALYHAKQTGRDRVVMYAPRGMQELGQAVRG